MVYVSQFPVFLEKMASLAPIGNTAKVSTTNLIGHYKIKVLWLNGFHG